MSNFIKGGFCASHRTYIISGVGILSAIGAYLVGDSDIFTTMQAIFTLAGIYFLQKSSETKSKGK